VSRSASRVTRLVIVAIVAAAVFVGFEVVRTLYALQGVEKARDSWQRPEDVIRALALQPGDTVVDFGSGAGYFSRRLAPIVGAGGRVIAVDVRRQSLAFLWIRSVLRREWQIDVVASAADDPRLPEGRIDALLIVNAYHELADRATLLRQLQRPLKPGGRLVVADRRHAADRPVHAGDTTHAVEPDIAEREIHAAGFTTVTRDDTFIRAARCVSIAQHLTDLPPFR